MKTINSLTMPALLWILCSLVFLGSTIAEESAPEWCTNIKNVGTFKLAKDCFLYNEVSVENGTLSIIGVERFVFPKYSKNTDLPIISRAQGSGKHRFFTVTKFGKLSLTRIRLTNGDVMGLVALQSPGVWGGGAIFVSGATASVTLLDCLLYRNKAYAGGSVYAQKGAFVLANSTQMEGFTVTGVGGGWWCGLDETICSYPGPPSQRRIEKFGYHNIVPDDSRVCVWSARCNDYS